MTRERGLKGEVAVIVPSGMLGAGLKAEHVQHGIRRGARAIACDSGSTDSGPSYLARGVSKMNREAVKRDLEILIKAAAGAGIPLLVGTCGTAGSDAGVDWTAEIAVEVARERRLQPRIALLYSEQSVETLKRKLAWGLTRPLAPSGALTDELLDSCDRIVALMGPEPYIAALRQGATIVLGGRTTDPAVLAAVPIMMGAGFGPSWHAAKVAECGGQCTERPRAGGVLMRVGADAFEMEPLDAANQCTPNSVSAHMLYETIDPNRMSEPGGTLDVTDASYLPVDARTVRVTGSRWQDSAYTMKLEGAASGCYQTIMLVGIEDTEVLANLDTFIDRLYAALLDRVDDIFGRTAGEYDISLRPYGWNAVSGQRVPADAAPPREVGLLFVATAATQELATKIAKACNPYFFHFPLRTGIELPSYAFPFSPAEIERGPVFEFKLNHVVEVDDPCELVRTAWIDLSEKVRLVAHG